MRLRGGRCRRRREEIGLGARGPKVRFQLREVLARGAELGIGMSVASATAASGWFMGSVM